MSTLRKKNNRKPRYCISKFDTPIFSNPTDGKVNTTQRSMKLHRGTLVCVIDRYSDAIDIIRIVDVDEVYKGKVSDSDSWRCPSEPLEPIDELLWPLLLAVPWNERGDLVRQKTLCEKLAKTKEGDEVFLLSAEGICHPAVVRYKGVVPNKAQGVFFGIEILDDNCEGDNDGKFGGRRFFECKPKRGIFASANRVLPTDDVTVRSEVKRLTAEFEAMMHKSAVASTAGDRLDSSTRNRDNCYEEGEASWNSKTSSSSSSSVNGYSKDCPLKVGDSVVWLRVEDDSPVDCIVARVNLKKNEVLIESDMINSPTGSKTFSVPVHELIKASDFYSTADDPKKESVNLISWENKDNNNSVEDLIGLSNTSYLASNNDAVSSDSDGSGYYDSPERDENLAEGSLVEVVHQGEHLHGVIKWIGRVKHGRKKSREMAGIEMEEEAPEFGNGSLNGTKRFECNPNRSLFVPLSHCRRDARFADFPAVGLPRQSEDFGGGESPIVVGAVEPLSGEEDISPICGKFKGIQGHHNSCYLDATLFSMFTFTGVFDTLLFRPPNANDIEGYQEVQRVLREEIVNPLRKHQFVRADRVMKLRRLMEKLSSVSGLTTEEKDPEEFLTSLIAQILRAEPFLKLNSGQEAYHYQLFVEKNEKLGLPNVQQLFEQSFFASDIKLKEVPSCLIIQMPRFGKSFKMYPRILPSQLLDVTDVIEDSPRQCSVCGRLAKIECRECFDQGASLEFGLQKISFCPKCYQVAHNHERRRKHTYRQLSVPADFTALQEHCIVPRLYMQLFAVVCIQTSHYVAFVKCGIGDDAPWCFFDSMADRKGEQNGYNIPEVVPCPDLPQWLSEKGAHNLQQIKDDRQLPEHAKRLLCDAYMCMYQSREVMMYR